MNETAYDYMRKLQIIYNNDPEGLARAGSLYITRLEARIADLEADLEAAESRCENHRIKSASRAGTIAELEAIVNKLPKTADGVPMLVGGAAWFFIEREEASGEYGYYELVEDKISFISSKTMSGYRGDFAVCLEREDWEGGNQEFYSTREAAEAARSKP